MKHLLNGVAIAAVMALAMPAFAQNPPTTPQNAPMTPSTPPKAAPAPAPAPASAPSPAPKSMAPMATKPMQHMAVHHRYRGWSEGDKMTEQLNKQELQRIMGGAPPPAPAPMPSNYQTPGKPDTPPMAAPPPPAR